MSKERYVVSETREVVVMADSAAEALTMTERAFQNPGEPAEGMVLGIGGIPKIVKTTVERD